MNKRIVLTSLGVLISLMAAWIMFDGTVFGENTSGYATVIGIFGIGIISSSRTIDLKKAVEEN